MHKMKAILECIKSVRHEYMSQLYGCIIVMEGKTLINQHAGCRYLNTYSE